MVKIRLIHHLLFFRKSINISAGKLARLSNGSTTVNAGDSAIMVTAVTSNKMTAANFLPLSVDIRQKVSAAGRNSMNFWRRELGEDIIIDPLHTMFLWRGLQRSIFIGPSERKILSTRSQHLTPIFAELPLRDPDHLQQNRPRLHQSTQSRSKYKRLTFISPYPTGFDL